MHGQDNNYENHEHKKHCLQKVKHDAQDHHEVRNELKGKEADCRHEQKELSAGELHG
jgi:hypothetical protein